MDTQDEEDLKAAQLLMLREMDRSYQSAAPAPPVFQHEEGDWEEADYSTGYVAPEVPYTQKQEIPGAHLVSELQLKYDRDIQVSGLSHWKSGKQKKGNEQAESANKFESCAALIKDQALPAKPSNLILMSKNVTNHNNRILQNLTDQNWRK